MHGRPVMEAPPEIKDKPLTVLSADTVRRLSMRLDQHCETIRPGSDHIGDYRGLAELYGKLSSFITEIGEKRNPTGELLKSLQGREATLSVLWQNLQLLGRTDVLRECAELFIRDTDRWINRRPRDAVEADEIKNEKRRSHIKAFFDKPLSRSKKSSLVNQDPGRNWAPPPTPSQDVPSGREHSVEANISGSNCPQPGSQSTSTATRPDFSHRCTPEQPSSTSSSTSSSSSLVCSNNGQPHGHVAQTTSVPPRTDYNRHTPEKRSPIRSKFASIFNRPRSNQPNKSLSTNNTKSCVSHQQISSQVTSSSSSSDGAHHSSGRPNSPSSKCTQVQKKEVLSIDDVGCERPMYDAYVNCAEQDIPFAKEMLAVLEQPPYNLHLFLSERQLMPGGSKYEDIAAVVEDRCRGKVVIILTRHYSDSEGCQFVTNFARALDPGSKQRKIIPVVYENTEDMEIPRTLKGMFLISKLKDNRRGWYWTKLCEAIRQ